MSQFLVSEDYHNNFLCDNFHFVKLLQRRRGREQDDEEDENDEKGRRRAYDKTLAAVFISFGCWTRHEHEMECDTFSLSKLVTRWHLWWMRKFPSSRKNEPRQQWEFLSFFWPFSQSLHFISLDMPTFSGHLKFSLFVSSSLASGGSCGDVFNFHDVL